MPTYDVPAKAWTYDADLGDAVSAATYEATYNRPGADGKFNPDYFQQIRVFRGEADPDLVRIRPTTDGVTDEVIVGVVDINAANREAGAVRGRFQGRDTMALALDRYAAAPFTLDGMAVGAGGAIAYRETFKGAVQRVAAAAGLTAVFDCGDYKLGRSLAVTTDRTLGEYLQDLLEPWRLGEKWRVDAWTEGTMLRVARRGAGARGTVEVRAERILSERFEKSAMPAVDGVRVEGAGYEVEEDDVPDSPEAVAGLPWTAAYSVPYGPDTVTKTVGGKLTVYTVEGTEWFDRQGRMTASFQKVTYLLMGGRAATRVETFEKSATFWEDSTLAYDGAPKTERETFRVDQVWRTAGGGLQQGTEVVRERETSWAYYANGDVRSEDGAELERDEQATLPLPVKTDRAYRYTYRRSGGRVLRDADVTEVDAASGAVNRSFRTTDQGAFRSEAGQERGAVARAGRRMAQRTVSAGPDPAGGKLRVARSELLGDPDSCEAVRQDLIDEHASVRITAVLAMAPDLRVRVGKVLTVPDAPAWWPATSFTVTHVRANDDGEGGMAQEVEGVAWAVAP